MTESSPPSLPPPKKPEEDWDLEGLSAEPGDLPRPNFSAKTEVKPSFLDPNLRRPRAGENPLEEATNAEFGFEKLFYANRPIPKATQALLDFLKEKPPELSVEILMAQTQILAQWASRVPPQKPWKRFRLWIWSWILQMAGLFHRHRPDKPSKRLLKQGNQKTER